MRTAPQAGLPSVRTRGRGCTPHPAFSLSDSVSRPRREVVCFNTPLSDDSPSCLILLSFFFFFDKAHITLAAALIRSLYGANLWKWHNRLMLNLLSAAMCLIKRSKQTAIKSRCVSVCERFVTWQAYATQLHLQQKAQILALKNWNLNNSLFGYIFISNNWH